MSRILTRMKQSNLTLPAITIQSCKGPIRVELGDGASRHFGDARNFTAEILRQINEERRYERFFKDRSGLVLLDIGANIGLVTLYAQPACRRIVAIEPTPAHCEILWQLGAPYNNIEIVQAALSATNGPVEFFLCPHNSTMNSLLKTGEASCLVEGVTLDALCERLRLDRVDLCKVDIEGSEYQALTVEQFGKNRQRIRAYYIETHPGPEFGQIAGRERLETLLAQCGYRIETLGPETTYACL